MNIAKVLKSFDSWGGSGMICNQEPTNQQEFNEWCVEENMVVDENNPKPLWTGTIPTWEEIIAKKTELEQAEQTKKDDKVSAYRKLGMTDAEINAIDSTLLA